MSKHLKKPDIEAFWDEKILPTLMDYIRIPNKSSHFDPHWKEHGYMDKAVDLVATWCQQEGPANLKVEVVEIPDRTPIIFMEIPGTTNDTVLLYGHLDKQPEMTGWREDLNPWVPHLKEDRLYGRGSADDGYAAFASIAALNAISQEKNYPRCVVLIEASEESGSPDLPFYVEALKDRIGNPSLIICLDSGCHTYDQLWVTTSLRGLVSGVLNIEVLDQGIHSGIGSGIVPSCFQVLFQLLSRIEKHSTSEIVLDELHVKIPPERLKQTEEAADILGSKVYKNLPFAGKTQPITTVPFDLLLNQTWKPSLSIIGIEGAPDLKSAGNVTLPSIAVKLSMRLPPTLNAKKAALRLKKTLETSPPSKAKVSFDILDEGSGWNAPAEKPWLKEALDQASLSYFGKKAAYMGEGGSIPFMGMLGQKYPKAQFLITGVLGPESNAHGPNEFLHIPTAKKLTYCIIDIILALSSASP